jgi:sec-independent protein translocase protein TatC
VARVVDKRRARRDAAEHFHGLSDDEASPLDARPSGLDATPTAPEDLLAGDAAGHRSHG